MRRDHALAAVLDVSMLLAGVAVVTAQNAPPAPQPIAPAATTTAPPLLVQNNNSCISACRSQYHQCLIASKGSPNCAAQQDACLRSCLRR